MRLQPSLRLIPHFPAVWDPPSPSSPSQPDPPALGQCRHLRVAPTEPPKPFPVFSSLHTNPTQSTYRPDIFSPATLHFPTFVLCRIQDPLVWMLSDLGGRLTPTHIPLRLKILMWITAACQSPSGTPTENITTSLKAGCMMILSSQTFKRRQVCSGASWAQKGWWASEEGIVLRVLAPSIPREQPSKGRACELCREAIIQTEAPFLRFLGLCKGP